MREGLRRLLALDKRVQVIGEAASAEEALEAPEVAAAQVVLMDIRLPGISGIEATRQIKAKLPGLRVVILSAFGEEYLMEAIKAGADGYVLKTSPLSDLVRAVVQAAEGEPPLDSSLTGRLFGQVAELARASRPPGLSERKVKILRMVAGGTPSKEIAHQLSVSEATVKRELRTIFDYLGVGGRAQAVAEAFSRRLLS
ncbi:MAG: response regulator transcription factor [Chloroflexi bacterium]|nr:response regulator transcription factor [Chloroflexota bacterium]